MDEELSNLKEQIKEYYLVDEEKILKELFSIAELSQSQVYKIQEIARKLVVGIRKMRVRSGGLDAFLFEYDLSSDEGIALMCMAEALLRIPDSRTMDKLIKDKLTAPDWSKHLGSSNSSFVNAATWGLMLTGQVINADRSGSQYLKGVLGKVVRRSGEPIIRQAVGQAMKILGRQFVMGTTIDSAMKRAKDLESKGYRYSYDMLGEAACNQKDARQYFDNYMNSIIAIGKDSCSKGPIEGPGVSVKLSALHPRYEDRQKEIVFDELYPRVYQLALEAKKHDIGFTIDAEEADRLEIFMEIFERLVAEPELKNWNGLGLAVQAYQKRALPLLKWIKALATMHKRKIMVRLVKGAYWDSEIKHSQLLGLEDYPVFTRKNNTDISYIACVKELANSDDYIYPQFATHNAYTVGVVIEICSNKDYEFQCLHGMGDSLYNNVIGKGNHDVPCRIYAPVGGYDNLLAYLVRRLLENGANTSFVNRIIDESSPIEDIISDPCSKALKYENYRHQNIPLPKHIFGEGRENSSGIDFNNSKHMMEIVSGINNVLLSKTWCSKTSVDDTTGTVKPCFDPSDRRRQIGTSSQSSIEQIYQVLSSASKEFVVWDNTPVSERASYLVKFANLLEENKEELYALLVREAGKTIDDAVNELREAVDFCRYYAKLACDTMNVITMPGVTGESNQLSLQGRGVFLCISPWNFPLAIFIGQVSAALVTGNTVLAKPASQTTLIASRAVELMHEAGIPRNVVRVLIAGGKDINDVVIPDPRIQGIMFTGSNDTATRIQRGLAARGGAIAPFIAETGGINAMIVDSTALVEQVIKDVIQSAFGSAGQRCSALRVLYLQKDIADKFKETLIGAMQEIILGDPLSISTDVGPVIDASSLDTLLSHEAYLKDNFKLLYKVPVPDRLMEGNFFGPCAYEVNHIRDIGKEVFGPILHVITYSSDSLDEVIDDINSIGYGLTFGIHSRIDENIDYISSRVRVGNIYVNRNMTGAVVGSQPFGGQGLSGTGPKAGGPSYLQRLTTERTVCVNTAAVGGNASLLSIGD